MTEAIKPWRERTEGLGGEYDSNAAQRWAMKAEIAELRARVAELEQEHPPRVTNEMWQAGMDMLQEVKEMQGCQACVTCGQPVERVGDSNFEDWYQSHPKACGGDKQLARDAYAAGMGDSEARQPMSDEQRRKLLDRTGAHCEGWDGEEWDQAVISAVEAFHGIGAKT